MKRLLLASAIAIAPLQAHAMIAVEDIAAELGITKETVETVKNGITQLQQLQTEVQQLQQYAFMAENIIHDPSLGTVMPVLNAAGIGNSLPINPYAVQGLLTGYGGMNSLSSITGKLSGLSGLVNGSYNADHIYDCTDNTFGCQQQKAAAAANAGLKGIAGQLYTDLTNHMEALGVIRTKLLETSDPKTMQDLTAQINLEQTWVANTAAQLQAITAMHDAQKRVNEQQADEKLSADFAAFVKAAPQ